MNNVQRSRPKRRLRMLMWSVIVAFALVAGGLLIAWWVMIRMPGESYQGEQAELNVGAQSLSEELRRHVTRLAGEIGERNLNRYPQLERAADYLQSELESYGHPVARQTYTETSTGLESANLEVEIAGASRPGEIVIVGAHFDSIVGSPGANDNASGCAAVLALARRLADHRPQRTLRFVLFTNEEPPYFQTPDMGSAVYARRCRARDEHLVAVLSIETIGYYTDEPGSQQYPPGFNLLYPSEGNFVAVVGNVGSRRLVRQVVRLFREHAAFPSEGAAVPGEIRGVGWSDHWSFWQQGYQGVMITDTAPFRYPYYHTRFDTPDRLDYHHMARIVQGLEGVIVDLADAQ